MTFDEWYEKNRDKLMEDYIRENPEDFPTDDSMSNAEDHKGFQDYCDEKFKEEPDDRYEFICPKCGG